MRKIRSRLHLKGLLTGAREDIQIVAAGNLTLYAHDSGKVVVAGAAAVQTFTLPAATNEGATFTFICNNAGGEILIDPQAGEQISCKATEGGANVTPAAGTGIKNTALTNVLGDRITLVADGVSKWHTVGQSGTWASQ